MGNLKGKRVFSTISWSILAILGIILNNFLFTLWAFRNVLKQTYIIWKLNSYSSLLEIFIFQI